MSCTNNHPVRSAEPQKRSSGGPPGEKRILLRAVSLIALVAVCAAGCAGKAEYEKTPAASSSEVHSSEENAGTGGEETTMSTFRNPISEGSAPDPFVTYDPETGYYYALFTCGDRVELFRSRHIATLVSGGDSKVVYRANGPADGIWGDIWAPEMHRGSDGKWYIYTSGRIRQEPSEKRIFVLRAESGDPFGDWKFVRLLYTSVFAIDPTVYTAPDGTQYFVSSRVDPEYGQVLDICRMESPVFLDGKRTMIAKAELEWELVKPYTGKSAIVEGAFFLEHAGRLFLIYSANGCWSDRYALGVLEYTGGDMCDASSWIKHPEPLLVAGNGVYGPGHASFFLSPDGTEVYCAYHGMKEHNENATAAPRYMNVQKVFFDETGYPVMGEAVGYGTDIPVPSGEK